MTLQALLVTLRWRSGGFSQLTQRELGGTSGPFLLRDVSPLAVNQPLEGPGIEDQLSCLRSWNQDVFLGVFGGILLLDVFLEMFFFVFFEKPQTQPGRVLELQPIVDIGV